MSDAESRQTHAGGTGGRKRTMPASHPKRFSVAGFLLVVAAWVLFPSAIQAPGISSLLLIMSALNFLGFVSAVIGLQQSNRERNQNEVSMAEPLLSIFDPRSRTIAKTALILALPGLLFLFLLIFG